MSALIFQITLPELAPWRRARCDCALPGCRGFIGPFPPPLWIKVTPMCLLRGTINSAWGFVNYREGVEYSNESWGFLWRPSLRSSVPPQNVVILVSKSGQCRCATASRTVKSGASAFKSQFIGSLIGTQRAAFNAKTAVLMAAAVFLSWAR